MTANKEISIIGQVTYGLASITMLIAAQMNEVLSKFGSSIILMGLILSVCGVYFTFKNNKNLVFYTLKLLQYIVSVMTIIIAFIAPLFGFKFIFIEMGSTLTPVTLALLLGSLIIIGLPVLKAKGIEVFDE